MNYNRVVMAGRLVRDPESKFLPTGICICAFTVATSRKYKDKHGVAKEDVAFVECEAWDKLAELVTQYTRKGSVVLVEGRLKQENWDDKVSGQKRSKLKVVAESVQFGSKPEGGSQQPAPSPSPTAAAVPTPAGEPDDVPF